MTYKGRLIEALDLIKERIDLTYKHLDEIVEDNLNDNVNKHLEAYLGYLFLDILTDLHDRGIEVWQ